MIPSNYTNLDHFLESLHQFNFSTDTSPEILNEISNTNPQEETINENNSHTKKRKVSANKVKKVNNGEIVKKIDNLELLLNQNRSDESEIIKKLDNIELILKQIKKPRSDNNKKLNDLDKKIEELKDKNEAQQLKEMFEKAQKNIDRLKDKNLKLKEKNKEIKDQSKKEKEELEKKNKNLLIDLENLKMQAQKDTQALIQRSQYYEAHYLSLLQAIQQPRNIQSQEMQSHFPTMPSQQLPLPQQMSENPASHATHNN